MACIHPTGWRELAVTGAAQREIETLTELDGKLPDAYHVFHGVHWTKVERSFSVYGEIDFIIASPCGRVLVIEQKSGFLTETQDGLMKSYGNKTKSVRNQLLRNVSNLIGRFGKAGGALSIDYLLYCPDHTLKNPEIAGIDAARIVDASKRDQLSNIVQALLPISEPTVQGHRVLRFFGDILELRPDPSAMIGQAGKLVTRLASGLATWARQLDFSPFRLRVTGTAGSGKTQLAVAEFTAAIEAGLRPLYVCYNRPLADHIRRLIPDGGRVATFHMLCDAYVRARGGVPDYRSSNVFADIESALAQGELPDAWRCDVLIIDEGQDFSEAWRDSLLRMIVPNGRVIWLEDPMQNLYGREPVSLPGWVTLRARTNYRSPRDVLELLATLDSRHLEIEAGSPFKGADIDFLTYPSSSVSDLYAQTKKAIGQCLGSGFALNDIALVSFHGRDKSALLNLDALGPYTLKSFTGGYDPFGKPFYRDGELFAESVYRFKGQSAPAVIFTEIDFEQLDERVLRKLFVGMTRARLRLVLVLSEPAATALLKRM